MGQKMPAPISGDQLSHSTNKTRGNRDRNRAVPEMDSAGRTASGSGDRLLSDARRRGSCQCPPQSGKWRRGLGGAGRRLPPAILGLPARLDPGSRLLGCCAVAARDCGASLRYLFSREAPQSYCFPFSPLTDAEERGGTRFLPCRGVFGAAHQLFKFPPLPASRFCVGSAGFLLQWRDRVFLTPTLLEMGSGIASDLSLPLPGSCCSVAEGR